MTTLAKKIQLLQEVKSNFGNNIDCNATIQRLIGHLYKCPQCNGAGVIHERYNAYPSGLPDSGWGEDWQYREKTCPLCDGEGYTKCEYKPRMVQDGWTKA